MYCIHIKIQASGFFWLELNCKDNLGGHFSTHDLCNLSQDIRPSLAKTISKRLHGLKLDYKKSDGFSRLGDDKILPKSVRRFGENERLAYAPC